MTFRTRVRFPPPPPCLPPCRLARVRRPPSARLHPRAALHSRRSPAYNREYLDAPLERAGILYGFLGRELGAKATDPAFYEGGRFQYRRLAASAAFKEGLAHVLDASRTHRLALMCAEKEPLACHRMLLVVRELEARGVPILHIHADGHLESHADALRRLRALVGVRESDLLKSQRELDEEAYALQEQRIASARPPPPAPPDPSP